jgi:hypothetical protein
VPEEIPAWKVTFKVAVIAYSHEEAMEWAADQLDMFVDDQETLGGSARVEKEPIDFDEEDEE